MTMKTNCICPNKTEEWQFDRELGCWYANRECGNCEYYWEGPDHSKTNVYVKPTTGKVTLMLTEVGRIQSLREREGAFRIYCYDIDGRYGIPVKFDQVQDIFNFCELNKYSHSEIKVITNQDEICISLKEGLYVFPEQWHKFNSVVDGSK